MIAFTCRLNGWALVFCGVLALAACTGNPGEGESAAMETARQMRPAVIHGLVALAGQDSADGVQVYIPGTSHLSITGSDGAYRLEDLRPGTYSIEARATGYVSKSIAEVTVPTPPGGEVFELPTAQLEPRATPDATPTPQGREAGRIEGRVTIAGFEPDGLEQAGIEWTNCRVELVGTPYRTTCGPVGDFMLWSIPPDTYQIQAILDGFEMNPREVRLLPGEARDNVRLEMAPMDGFGARRITGYVDMLDPAGERTNDFQLVTVRVEGRPELATLLGPDGSFTIPGLSADSFIVYADAEGYTASPPVEVDLTEQAEMAIQLTLRAGEASERSHAEIFGLAFKNLDGMTDMSGIRIALAGTSHAAMTNMDGEYRITGIAPGTYELLAQAEGFETARQGPIEVAADGVFEAEGILLEPILDRPRVLRTDPEDGAKDILITREIPVTIRFSKKMDPESLRAAIGVEPEAAYEVYTGTDLRSTDFDVARVVLFGAIEEPAVRFQTRYRVTVSEAARDFEGLGLEEPFEMSFTTGDPSVIGTVPGDGDVKRSNSPREPLVVYFNAAMDHDTLDGDVLRIRPRLGSAPVLSVRDDPLTGWTRVNVSGVWEEDTTYSITVTRAARTRGQDSLANTPYTFRFETPKLRLYEQPTAPRGR